MTTSIGEKGAGRCACRLLMCPRVVVSSFTTLPLGARGGVASIFDCDSPWRSFHCFLLASHYSGSYELGYYQTWSMTF